MRGVDVVVAILLGVLSLAFVFWVFYRGLFAGGRAPDRSAD